MIKLKEHTKQQQQNNKEKLTEPERLTGYLQKDQYTHYRSLRRRRKKKVGSLFEEIVMTNPTPQI